MKKCLKIYFRGKQEDHLQLQRALKENRSA